MDTKLCTTTVRTLSALLAAWVIALSAHAAELRTYQGSPHADFTLTDLAGNSHTLSSLKGKVVVVNFWATYCTPCLKELPSMQRLARKMHGKPFVILAVAMGEERHSVSTFLQHLHLTPNFPVLLDSNATAAEAWQVEALPTSFVIDPSGTIRYHILGSTEWDSATTLALLDGLLKR
jgi:peroxiredoxin